MCPFFQTGVQFDKKAGELKSFQDWNAEITAKIVSMLGKVKPLNVSPGCLFASTMYVFQNIFSRFQSGTAQLIHWEGFVSTVNAIVEIVDIIKQTLVNQLSAC